jgi:hypothetical protein
MSQEGGNPKMKKLTVPLIIIVLSVIIGLGYVDYLTGDYSMNPFYLLVIFGVSWFTGRGFGTICAVEAVFAEIFADYYSHHGDVLNSLYYWNWTSDLLIFLSLCFLTAYIRKMVDKDSKDS